MATTTKAKTTTRRPAVPRCRVCGCTQRRACDGGCWWIEPDLCSACVDRAVGLFVRGLLADPAFVKRLKGELRGEGG